jgi:hypothetical protein
MVNGTTNRLRYDPPSTFDRAPLSGYLRAATHLGGCRAVVLLSCSDQIQASCSR